MQNDRSGFQGVRADGRVRPARRYMNRKRAVVQGYIAGQCGDKFDMAFGKNGDAEFNAGSR